MNRKRITVMSLIGFFFVGFVPIMLAPSLPFLIREFDLSLAAAGAALAARSGGSFFGVLAGGFLSDYIGRKPVIVLSSLLQALALGLIGLAPSWLLIVLFFSLAGFSIGALNPPINAVIADVNSEKRGMALNMLHGLYSIGAMTGPLAAAFILTTQSGWRTIFFGSCLIWFVYAVIMLFTDFPAPEANHRKSRKPSIKDAALLLSPTLIMLFLVSFLYNGTATSLVSWINTYLDAVDFPLLLGASMVSIFYLGLALGRFACGILSERIGYAKVILVCSVGSLLFYPVAIYFTHPLLIATGVFFAGLFFSGLHPTGMALASRRFPAYSGTIASLLSVAMAIGAMSVPWLTGITADYAGFRAGFGISVALLAVLVVIAFWLLRTDSHTSA